MENVLEEICPGISTRVTPLVTMTLVVADAGGATTAAPRQIAKTRGIAPFVAIRLTSTPSLNVARDVARAGTCMHANRHSRKPRRHVLPLSLHVGLPPPNAMWGCPYIRDQLTAPKTYLHYMQSDGASKKTLRLHRPPLWALTLAAILDATLPTKERVCESRSAKAARIRTSHGGKLRATKFALLSHDSSLTRARNSLAFRDSVDAALNV